MSQALFETLLKSNPALVDSLRLHWTPYIPHSPTPKQRVFLLLPHAEAGYGGAAGGGKSDALLMGALQYVDTPGYHAILFRKTLTDLRLPGALLDRSREWLLGTDAQYTDQAWRFPSGAVIQFGYLANELDKFRYQGAEFQYIGFDEVTQFNEDDYLYLRSRLRRPRCPLHAGNVVDGKPSPLPDNPICPTCQEFGPVSRVPLRMRCATNPGGVGHLWVKRRFRIGPLKQPNGKIIHTGGHPKRPFIPAFVTDNPYLDQQEYIKSLQELDPVTRGQLLRGDWAIAADGRFRQRWVRYYSVNGPYVILGPDRKGETIRTRDCRCFVICDVAGSAREGPGDLQVYRGAPSWTVIGTFLQTPNNHLLWWDMVRFRKEIPDVYQAIKKVWRVHTPEFVGIESSGLGIGLFQACVRAGLPVKALLPRSQDKLVRATDACNRMEQGRIWLPQTAPWLEDLEAELFTWVGHPHEQDDQVDVLAYAAMEVSRWAAYSSGEDVVHAGHMFEEQPEVF